MAEIADLPRSMKAGQKKGLDGRWVKDFRISYRQSQKQFAAAIGVKLETLKNWERRKTGIGPEALENLLGHPGKDPILIAFKVRLEEEKKKASAAAQETQETAEAVPSNSSLESTLEPAVLQAIETAFQNVMVPTAASQQSDAGLELLLVGGNAGPAQGIAAYFSPFTWFAFQPWEHVKGIDWTPLNEAERSGSEENPYLQGFEHARRLIEQKVLPGADHRFQLDLQDYCAQHNRESAPPPPTQESIRRRILLDELLAKVSPDLLPPPANIFFKMGYLNGLLETLWAALRLPNRYHSNWKDELACFTDLGGAHSNREAKSEPENHSPEIGYMARSAAAMDRYEAEMARKRQDWEADMQRRQNAATEQRQQRWNQQQRESAERDLEAADQAGLRLARLLTRRGILDEFLDRFESPSPPADIKGLDATDVSYCYALSLLSEDERRPFTSFSLNRLDRAVSHVYRTANTLAPSPVGEVK